MWPPRAGFTTANNTFGDLLYTIDDAQDDLQTVGAVRQSGCADNKLQASVLVQQQQQPL
jgi:hypothetical protein